MAVASAWRRDARLCHVTGRTAARTLICAALLVLVAATTRAQNSSSKAPAPAVTALPHDLLHDALALPSEESAWWAAGGAAATVASHRFDDQVTGWFADVQTRALRHAFDPGKWLGETWVQVGAAAATYAIGRLGRQPESEAAGLEMVGADLLTEGLAQAFEVRDKARAPRLQRSAFVSVRPRRNHVRDGDGPHAPVRLVADDSRVLHRLLRRRVAGGHR
jgi:hypothetical protein